MAWEKRRDELLDHAADAMPSRSRKNRRRWCRGKVGVEHQWVHEEGYGHFKGKPCYTIAIWDHPRGLVSRSRTVVICTEAEVCSACGKVLRSVRCRLHGSAEKDGQLHSYART